MIEFLNDFLENPTDAFISSVAALECQIEEEHLKVLSHSIKNFVRLGAMMNVLAVVRTMSGFILNALAYLKLLSVNGNVIHVDFGMFQNLFLYSFFYFLH